MKIMESSPNGEKLLENTAGIGEIASDEHFLLFSKRF